jgi:hypothetical protein
MPRTKLANPGRAPEHNVYDLRGYIPTTGNIFFVDSGADAGGNGLTPESAVTTLNAAVALCTANNGDIIYIIEGHAETLEAAADVDISKAGLTIIGLGRGGDRPTFTFSTAADGTFAIGASSIYLENLLFVANFTNGVTVGVDIDGAHTDVVFKNCEWRAAASTKEFLKGVTIAEDADRITFDGCRFTEVTAGDALSAIFTESTAGLVTVKDCTFQGDWSVAVLDLDDDALVPGPQVFDNYVYNADVAAGLFCTVTSATVAVFIGNRSGIGKANTVPVSDATASVFIDNLATDAAAISELKYPATPTAWS